MFKFRRSSSLCSPTREIFQDDPKEQAEMNRATTEQPSEKPDPKEMTKWSFNGDKLKANFRKSFIGQVICDRKRKERQESISQDDCAQEKKVVRSVSDDEGVHDPDKNVVKDIRRSVSHDDFGKKPEAKFDKKNILPASKHEHQGGSTDEVATTAPAVLIDRPEANMMRKVDYSAGDYEPEAQRQMERFVNYSAGTSTPTKLSKGHRRRHKSSHRHHNQASESSTASFELELEEEPTAPAEETHEDAESPVLSDETSSSEEDSSRSSVPLVVVDDSSSVENKNNSDTFRLDFSTLHHQVETSQPISFLDSISQGSNDPVMLSPRGGFYMKDGMDIPPSPPMYQIQVDPPLSRQSLGENESNLNKLNLLTRQVSNLKKTLRSLEEEYEQLFGYKPSKADKMKHKEMRKVVLQLVKAKKELKDLKEDPASLQEVNLPFAKGAPSARNSTEYLDSLSNTVKELQENLSSNRRVVGRSDNAENMSSAELQEEKSMMQKQLLILERRHGRPVSKTEKDIVRPLYDHYRIVKKLSGRPTTSILKEPTLGLDLVPILENEPLDTSCAVVEVRKPNIGSPKSTKNLRSSYDGSTFAAERVNDERGDGSNEEQWEESFSKMTLEELEKALKQVREDKRKFRSILRRFEIDFQEAKGRPPLKEEKYAAGDIEGVYARYKHARSIVRLLEVLVNKKKFPHLLQDQYQSED